MNVVPEITMRETFSILELWQSGRLANRCIRCIHFTCQASASEQPWPNLVFGREKLDGAHRFSYLCSYLSHPEFFHQKKYIRTPRRFE